jgi:ABC-type sugar transport system permease subunit
MNKIQDQRAWLLVLPVFALVAFSAVIPLMTVVNYSVQDTFGNNQFFWNGIGWYQDCSIQRASSASASSMRCGAHCCSRRSFC